MTKTSYMNDGNPQWRRRDDKMQPIILSKNDKPPLWDCLWKHMVDCFGLMPYVMGLPEGCKPLSPDEIQPILDRWQGEWQVQPLPPMAIKGFNSKFYVQYTTAHIDGDNVILSGGFHDEKRVSKSQGKIGGFDGFGGTSVNLSTTTNVQVQNEGQINKLIFFRAPDGKLYVDNVGSYLESEQPNRIRFITAQEYPMTLLRNGGTH